MKLTKHKSGCRGQADYGWLKTFYSFSFAGYYNPDRMNFGALRVLNDDIIQAGMGFGTHPHENMEIITIVLEGELEHRDSMGNGSVIKAGEIQVMSAGTGIQHSEYNPSDINDTKLLQIWIFPQENNIKPSYGQAKFSEEEFAGKLLNVVSPNGSGNKLEINQNSWLWLGSYSANSEFKYTLKAESNGLYIFVIKGNVLVETEKLNERDAVCIENITRDINIKSESDSKILIIEIPL